tara:strand:- start:527 stop:985 length:459 start_codon:yes stop_codon:yes gene_type:complete
MLLNKELLVGAFGSSSKPKLLNISWNTGTRTITAYNPPQNENDRPRINTWRGDGTRVVYMSAGNQVWNPDTSTFSTPWGNRTTGSIGVLISLNGSLSAGVDLFTDDRFPAPTLVPDISQWRTIVTNNPNEIQYQYVVNRSSTPTQTISITLN